MINFHRETTRMLLRGRSKALLLESCGPDCGLFDGSLCEDCRGQESVHDSEQVIDQRSEAGLD
ncbi:MAG: hypothetical protein MUC50_09470 [Myxococcota bacterium]|jgi:hypothetical protein|nr:hypothetical protein [Myxococcota bacterium]